MCKTIPPHTFMTSVDRGVKVCLESKLFFCFFNLDCKLNLHLLILFKVLREFIFQISWRTEEILYRLDVGWPKHSEYFTGTTFCVAVDSLNGLLYIAQVSKIGI